jgi:hypothetical protein
MAGKIALSILAAFGLVGFGYALHWGKVKNSEMPFKVSQYVTTGHSAEGVPAPFSVLVHETRVQRIVPGFVAPVDDVVWLPEPK